MAALRHKKHEVKMHVKIHKKKGGAVNEHEYNAVNAPEMSEAHETKEGFKKGGAKKKKAGGHVEAAKSAHRPDKKPRRAAGGSVLSSASKKSMAEKDEAGQGHEGDGSRGEDPDRGCYKSGGCATGGKLTYQERKHLPKADFVFKAERKYPIEDKAHARNALARVSQFGSSSEKSKVRSAVHRKYPDIGQKKG